MSATLARMVRGADTDDRGLTPESAGLYAAATGFQATSRDDFDNMARQFPLYDARYAFCRCDIAPAKGQPIDQWDVLAVSDGYTAARDRIVASVERRVADLTAPR